MKLLSSLRRYLVDPSYFIYQRKYKGLNCTIAPYAELSNVSLEPYVGIAHHAQVSNSSVGKRTSIGRYAKIRDCEIGRYCSISWDVTIGAPAHDLNRLSSHAFSYRKQFGIVENDTEFPQLKTVIGHDVWIGCGVTIIAGVTVGNGAVIGANAVVTHDVEPYTIVAGVPAKKMKDRFTDDKKAVIALSQWWNWDDRAIRQNIDWFLKNINDAELEELEKNLLNK